MNYLMDSWTPICKNINSRQLRTLRWKWLNLHLCIECGLFSEEFKPTACSLDGKTTALPYPKMMKLEVQAPYIFYWHRFLLSWIYQFIWQQCSNLKKVLLLAWCLWERQERHTSGGCKRRRKTCKSEVIFSFEWFLILHFKKLNQWLCLD